MVYICDQCRIPVATRYRKCKTAKNKSIANIIKNKRLQNIFSDVVSIKSEHKCNNTIPSSATSRHESYGL